MNPELLAAVLTEATELGWTAPEVAPTAVDPNGNRVVWPKPDGTNAASLTADGLIKFYRARGHRYFLLRVEPMLKAVSGPLMPWFQSMLAGYTEQVGDELFEHPALDCEVFVGGERIPLTDADSVARALRGEAAR